MVDRLAAVSPVPASMPQAPASVPNPDPTARTIEQLKSEISASREIGEAKLAGVREYLDMRIGSMDKALVILQTIADRIPSQIKDEVGALEKLVDEKLHLISTQIEERDVQREIAAKDVKSAVDAAFAASKEAVGEQNKFAAAAILKSEVGVTKQIDGIFELIKNNTKTTDDKFNDIKDRITAIESYGKGVSGLAGYIFGAAGFVVAIVSILVIVLRHTP